MGQSLVDDFGHFLWVFPYQPARFESMIFLFAMVGYVSFLESGVLFSACAPVNWPKIHGVFYWGEITAMKSISGVMGPYFTSARGPPCCRL